MNILTQGGLPRQDRLGNPIHAGFHNMMRWEAILHDPGVDGMRRLTAGISLLYGDNAPPIMAAAGELAWFYNGGKTREENKGRGGKKPQRLYDFEEDAGYLYAAFLSAYGVDLTDESRFLHWWQFLALFSALPEDTQMYRRMMYRGMDTSKMKGEEKKFYESQKKAVALKNTAVTGKSLREIENMNREKVQRRFEEAEKALRLAGKG